MNGRFLRSLRQPTGALKQVQLTVNVLKTPAVNLKEQFTRKNEVIRLSVRHLRQN